MSKKVLVRWCVSLVLIGGTFVGCERTNSTVQETAEFSFDDIAAQLAAEEAASQAEHEK